MSVTYEHPYARKVPIVKAALCEAGFHELARTVRVRRCPDEQELSCTFSAGGSRDGEDQAWVKALRLCGVPTSCWPCWDGGGPNSSPDCEHTGLCA